MARITIDEDGGTVAIEEHGAARVYALASPEGFALASRAWLRAGWDAKYVYSFSWLGRPVIQLPDDMLRLQEVIYATAPDVILETGIAHGGSLVFYASLFAALGKGRVIGVDIEIRPHNRAAIEAHRLKPLITLIEGSSVAPETVTAVKRLIGHDERVMVILDSNHTAAHVRAELEAYAPLVSPGSWLVACDGIMAQVAGAPRTKPEWTTDNPITAIAGFLADHPEFEGVEPVWPFNEGLVRDRVTYWPQAFLRRR